MTLDGRSSDCCNCAMPTECEAVRRMTSAVPAFGSEWQEHLDWWGDQTAGSYNDMSALAQWVVKQMSDGGELILSPIFAEMEALLTESPELHDVLVIGFLESVQNLAANSHLDPDVLLPMLGPRCTDGWFELVRMWHGSEGAGWAGRAKA